MHVLLSRAVERPEVTALTFLANGAGEGIKYTYGELDLQSRAVAAYLQTLGVAAGERALLLYPSGPEYMIGLLGCFYAGVIPVPGYPPDSARLTQSLPRLLSIIQDARPSVVLTMNSELPAVRGLSRHNLDLHIRHWLTIDDLDSSLAAEWQQPALQADSLALLQYTSGSTASPRGVMVTHGNLVANLDFIRRCFEITPSDAGVIWLPPYHDMGLIGGIMGTVHFGAPLILMPPIAFLKRPVRWLEAISKSRAVISGGPNFAYDLCVRRVSDEDRSRLDLSSWGVAFTGAEPIRAQTLDRFAETFKGCGFRREAFFPCYGLAEVTLMATGGRKDEAPIVSNVRRRELEQNRAVGAAEGESDILKLVSCGRSPDNQELLIVDPETRVPCPLGQVGEVWLSGPSVARGYWGRPEESRNTFQSQRADTGGGPYLRTGDLGFLKDGDLFVTGRLRDLIICDGRNHHPEDIEQTVEQSHPAIRPGDCAAFSIDVESEEGVVILAEVSRAYRPAAADVQGNGASLKESRDALYVEVGKSIRRAVAESHGLRAHAVLLLKPGELLRTSSGKIRRQACRAAFLDRTLSIFHESGDDFLQ
jgi:acyl-CoA synthetase (AMP-forming)/AMP-acid ligase II